MRGLRVVELGAGIGLPSLAAALRGAHVLATDWADDAVALLRANARRNSIKLRVKRVRWDAPERCFAQAPWELVLAADVLYEARNAEQLLALLPQLGGEILLADPGRPFAKAFLEQWDVEPSPTACIASGYGDAVVVLALAVALLAPPRPHIVWKPIPFGAQRKAEMRQYAERHYGIDSYVLKPKVIVEHYTATTSFSSAYNTFASDTPDPELHSLPGTCAHFIIDRDGTIYQLVRARHHVQAHRRAELRRNRDRARRHVRRARS